MAAVDIGINDDPVAGLDARDVVLRDLLYDARQLMANDPGIAYQRVGSPIRADVAAADTGTDNADQGLPRPRLGLGNVDTCSLPGLLK